MYWNENNLLRKKHFEQEYIRLKHGKTANKVIKIKILAHYIVFLVSLCFLTLFILAHQSVTVVKYYLSVYNLKERLLIEQTFYPQLKVVNHMTLALDVCFVKSQLF